VFGPAVQRVSGERDEPGHRDSGPEDVEQFHRRALGRQHLAVDVGVLGDDLQSATSGGCGRTGADLPHQGGQPALPASSGPARPLPSGLPIGSPEGALDCACGLYLNDPTAWLTPPTN
jgi:hypothetical protein